MSERLPHRLVRASAGTGKTYRLTQRFLELVVGGAAPERILATTFTRKAAGEILERLLLRLARAVRDPRAGALLAAELEAATGVSGISPHAFAPLLERVCGSLHRLQVSTLDSFFHRTLALFRHELGLPRFARVAAIADPLLEPLRVRGLEQALGDLSRGDIDTLLDLLGRLYRGDAQRSVVRSLDTLVLAVYEPYRSARDPEAWSALLHAGQPLSPPSLHAAIDRAMGALAAAPEALHKPVKADLEKVARGDWLALIAGGPAKKVLEDPAQPTYNRKPLPPALVATYRPLVEHAGAVLLERIAEQTIATHRLLAAFEAPFRELRRRAGVVLYSELVERLRGLVAGDAHRGEDLGDRRSELLLELFFRLDGAVHHLLLDELQDTSLEQWRAIEPVVEELLSYGDGSRSVFGVGDPKQSIYGWRGGRVELFAELEERMRSGAGEVEALAASWRSSPIVLDATNRVFGSLQANPALVDEPERAAAARIVSAFEPQVSAHPERPGYVVLATSAEWEGVFEADDPPAPAGTPAEPEDDAEEVEALELAEETQRPICHLDSVAERVCAIADRLDIRPSRAGEKPRAPISIGVLCLTNRTVRELRGRLEDRGVDASGEGAGPLDDDPAVAAVVSALRLAEHPGSSASAFHVASGPLGAVLGLTDWRRPDEAVRRLRRELAERGPEASVARWVRALSGTCDERNARRLQQLVELLPTLLGDDPGAAELARRIETSSMEEPMPATVRVMTVHQAKGLEFDVVVLGELERRIGELTNPLLETLRASTGAVSEVHRSTNQLIRGLSAQLGAARRQELERRALDDLGVLYVALTRARFELHLFIQPFENKGMRARTFAAVLANGLASGGAAAARLGGAVLYEAGRPLDADALRRHRGDEAAASEVPSLEAGAAPPLPSARDTAGRAKTRGLPWLAPSELGAGSLVSVAELLAVEPGGGALRGRVLHEWLAGIVWLDGALLDDEDALLHAARRHDPRSSDSQLRALLAELRRWTVSEPLRSILTRPPRGSRGEDFEVWRERPFVAERGGSLVRGVFDRAVIHLRLGVPAAAELFEWKTGLPGVPGEQPGEPGSAEDAPRQRQRHHAQVEAYRDALAAMLGLLPSSVSASIVYLSASPGGSTSVCASL